jgi:hypothetical protein
LEIIQKLTENSTAAAARATIASIISRWSAPSVIARASSQ